MSSRLQPRLASVSRLAVIGAGKLGTSLAYALECAGAHVIAVASRRNEHARELAARLESAQALAAAEAVACTELVLLTVPDDELASLAASLPWRAQQSVVHCSGALDLSVLEPARARGALTGCMHPLQTFPERFTAKERFSGIVFGIEADGALFAQLEAIVNALGARALPLAGKDRALYHAAAVFAGNYLCALYAAAEQAFTLAGLAPDLARAALAPLSQATLDNLRRLPIEEALTGPLARGDAATIARQLAALEPNPKLRALYRELAEILLARPLGLSAEQRARLLALMV